MRLDNLIIETRVRSGWAAIDLGIILGRMFWLRGVLLYMVLAVPIFALTRLVSDTSTLLPYLILWWFKPLFERPILYFMSREILSEAVGFWKTLRRWREWLLPCIGWVLTTRRISVGRGMFAPISLLEKPDSSEYGKRKSVLASKYANQSTWLTIVFCHLESFLAIACLVLLAIFFPEQIEINLLLLNELKENSAYLYFGFLLMMAVVAPFYTASGFILYISRRVELEGWDIEICFRDWMNDFKANPRQDSEAAQVRSQ